MTMSKAIIMHNIADFNDLPKAERWFWRHHCREVLAQQPWTTRYVMYRCQPAVDGVEKFGFKNYRVHENWVRSNEERRGGKGLLAFTPSPVHVAGPIANCPGEPTEDFLGRDLHQEDKSIFRWLVFYKYPEGVSQEEGDDWYINVHAPELMRQPGLIRFFSYKAFNDPTKPALPMDQFTGGKPLPVKVFSHWVRVSELWYEDSKSWRKNNIEEVLDYTPPSWNKEGKYPFFEAEKGIVSTFLLERPDQNMLRDYEPAYF